jgi:hypothetical protein
MSHVPGVIWRAPDSGGELMNTRRDLALPIDRLVWLDGQVLASRDLRDDQYTSDRLRHLHIRYLHKTWGVVEGLSVTGAGSSGVKVQLGYALDIEGRELLLPADMKFSAPQNVTASTTMYLVISRGSTLHCCATPDPSLLCPGVNAGISIEQGELSWKTVSQVHRGHDVLLARVFIQHGKVASAVDTSVQRRADTMAQPRIWSDITQPGQTGWTNGSEQSLVEIGATVDTTNAGFFRKPSYFAYLTGTSQAASGFILSASARRFTFVVRPAFAWTPGFQFDAATAESAGWTIAWVVIESLV